MNRKEKIKSQLSPFLPSGYSDYITDLILQNTVRFVISKPRKTKHGDFSSKDREGSKFHKITINGNLNKYQFLITTLHEFAHLLIYEKHKNRVKPHGFEWKSEFKRLLIPVINDENIPIELRRVLNKPVSKIKASSSTDIELKRVLNTFDTHKKIQVITLEEIELHEYFKFDNNVFQLGELRRTRFICRKAKTKKLYLINRLAEVEPLKNYSE